MANKIITQLTPVASIEAADEFEVQKSGETVTTKATMAQITAVEEAARIAQDSATWLNAGLSVTGLFVPMSEAWYLRAADFTTGLVDRGGAKTNVTANLYNAIRMLDSFIYDLKTNPAFGSVTDYTEFGSDGTMQQFGAATTYDDIYPSSVTTATGTNAPSFTAYSGGNLKAYEFLGAVTMKEIHIGFQINHKYTLGSDISPHIHLYVPNDVTGGTIKFGLEYVWADIDQVGAIAPITIYGTKVIGAGAGVQNNVIIEFTDIVGTGMGISSILMCRLFRDPTDGADTFASSVWLKSADIHVNQDTLGSAQEYIK